MAGRASIALVLLGMTACFEHVEADVLCPVGSPGCETFDATPSLILGQGAQVQVQGAQSATSTGAGALASKGLKRTFIEREYELMTRDKYVVTVKVRLSLVVREDGPSAQGPALKLIEDVLHSKVAYLVATQPSQASQLTAVHGFEDTRRGLMSALERRLGELLAQQRVFDTDYREPRVAVLSWRLKGEEVIRQKRANHDAKVENQGP